MNLSKDPLFGVAMAKDNPCREPIGDGAMALALLRAFYDDATSVHGIDTCRDENLLNRVRDFLDKCSAADSGKSE